LDAGNFVRTLTERQGQQVGCPDEIAYRLGWITHAELAARAEIFRKNDYGAALRTILEEGPI
jgi:glucose-1-phosphate thymidylyltransferase